MSSSDESDFDLELAAEKVLRSLLPAKSKEKYEKAYAAFNQWCSKRKILGVDEIAILVYFSDKLENYQALSAWSIYSMLKLTLSLNENIDISGFHQLKAFLKRKSDDYSAKKSEILKIQEIYKFLKEAPDELYLATKVALITCIYGACRRVELCSMTVDQIEYIEDGIKIEVSKTKNKTIREFVISKGGDADLDCVATFKRYADMRPAKTQLKRFLMCYRNNKCTNQAIGINTIGGYPKKIAEFLGLQNVKAYTGHCFRRTSTSFLADTGVNICIVKPHCGWKSDGVAEGYIVRSLNNKRSIAEKIMGSKVKKTDNEVPANPDGTNNDEDLAVVEKENDIAATSSSAAPSIARTGDQNVTIISTEKRESRVFTKETTTTQSAESPHILFRDLHNCNFYINPKHPK